MNNVVYLMDSKVDYKPFLRAIPKSVIGFRSYSGKAFLAMNTQQLLS